MAPRTATALRRAFAVALPAAAFALLALAVTARSGHPFPVDRALHDWAVAHRPAAATTLVRLLTATGTGAVPYLLALAAGWTVCRPGSPARRRTTVAVACAAVLALGQLVRTAVMEAVARPRPAAADWAAAAGGHAFPSGHTTTSAIAAGLLAWAAVRAGGRTTGRVVAVLCGCWAAAVGASRVYLGVHWPTDVLGGWLLAVAWLAASLPLLTALVERESVVPPGSDDESVQR
ncbi:phosphatase PAP2 family protein [Streptacidiphilus griseoplanus]|uniref:phosphatase PAP2 family protein n=1 Tax=Peterkaempfera griseoplana TaxID=66896 RepID=UPI0007C63790|nr:phosphatase PAP2 family protein [Peterkaempfera griseoplana]